MAGVIIRYASLFYSVRQYYLILSFVYVIFMLIKRFMISLQIATRQQITRYYSQIVSCCWGSCMETLSDLIIFLHDNAAIVFMFCLFSRAVSLAVSVVKKRRLKKRVR